MKLRNFLDYDKITIQCHDNPDADAIASGYGLYCYFKGQGKEVKFIYSGNAKIQKDNLCIMIEQLQIPIEYREKTDEKIEGVLITVDCQYGARNVTRFEADAVAIIDHHQQEITEVKECLIKSTYGSCSTLVWELLLNEAYDIKENENLQTALYYGLYMDTGQLMEIFNPKDKDLRDSMRFDFLLLKRLQNCNMSMKELGIVANSIINCVQNTKERYVIVHAQPCDANILGVISDLVLQVSEVDVCIVFNELSDGIKLSVRSCVREMQACHLAEFLTKEMGSGGGHLSKAGGFISKVKYKAVYCELAIEQYFQKRMDEYIESYDLIEAADYQFQKQGMKKYRKKNMPIGYVETTKVYEAGTPILVRTLEGDTNTVSDEENYVMIGIKGEVYPIKKEKFVRNYKVLEAAYSLEDVDYVPTIKNEITGEVADLISYGKTCVAVGEVTIYAKPLEKGIKIFTAWDKEKYMKGDPGDYLAVRSDDLHDVYVIRRDIFFDTYEEIVGEE